MSGTKGRLKLPGQDVDIPFTLVREFIDNYQGFVANTSVANIFSKEAGWIFEADKVALPTEPGLYVTSNNVSVGGTVRHSATILMLGDDGLWADGMRDTAERYMTQWGLTKVKLEVA